MIDPIWLSPLDIGHHRRVGGEDRPAAGRGQRLDQLRRRRRDRGPGGRAAQGVRDLRVQRMGFAPTTCPTTPVAGRALLSERAGPSPPPPAIWWKATRTGWVPKENPALARVEFKGPF